MRTRWVVTLSVVMTPGACAGATVRLIGPAAIERAWNSTTTANNRAVCAALDAASTPPLTQARVRRAITLGEANLNETFARWTYMLTRDLSDAQVATRLGGGVLGSIMAADYTTDAADAMHHLSAVCAAWGLR